MKNLKNAGIFVLVVLMLLSMILVGCTQSDPDNQEKTTTTEKKEESTAEATSAPEPEEPIEISYWSYWCANAVDGNYCETIIEDALNIDIKAVNISQSEGEQISLMLTSGEMPDCGWFVRDTDYMYYDNGLTRTIPSDLVAQYAPGFTELFSKHPVLEALVQVREDETEYYGLPSYSAYTAGNQYFYTDFYRKDWLDALGIDYPGKLTEVSDGVFMCETGYTLEEHKAVLDAFTYQDPDGNGEDDTVGTIGYAITGGCSLVSWTMLGAYDLCSRFSVEDNGSASYYYSTGRYKDILNYAGDLYQSGLVDPEIYTVDSEQFFEKAKNSYGGHFIASCNWTASWASTRPPMVALENNEGSEIMITPGLIGPNGDMGSTQYGAVPVANSTIRFYVNSNVTDEDKLIKILEFVDYTSFGDRRIELVFGEEGVDFTYDDEGLPVRNESFSGENERGIYAYAQWVQDEEMLAWTNDAIFRKTFDFTVGDGLWIQYLIKPYVYDLYGETNLNSLEDEYKSSLNTIVEEFMVGVITGETDLDAEWDNYLEKLNNAGYDKILEELNKAPLYTDIIGK